MSDPNIWLYHTALRNVPRTNKMSSLLERYKGISMEPFLWTFWIKGILNILTIKYYYKYI